MRILLIEDDFKTVQVIKQGLEENFYEVDVAYDGLIAKQLALRNKYAVIISDIILPGINGHTLIRELREAGLKAPILILSALGDTNDRVAGFDAGADQYMVKPFSFLELLARLRSLIKRSLDVQITQEVLKYEDLETNLFTKSVRRGDRVIKLTAQEFKLLEYFLRNQGRVLSKAQIAEKVWDIDFDRRTNYVEVYINYLRKKIDNDFERKFIHTVFGMGYVLR
jgi:two-component system copper resistance phosphate regulon response regulator CusR